MSQLNWPVKLIHELWMMSMMSIDQSIVLQTSMMSMILDPIGSIGSIDQLKLIILWQLNQWLLNIVIYKWFIYDDDSPDSYATNHWSLNKQESGWWFQHFWKIWKSIGMIIHNIWENKSHVPVKTNQIASDSHAKHPVWLVYHLLWRTVQWDSWIFVEFQFPGLSWISGNIHKIK